MWVDPNSRWYKAFLCGLPQAGMVCAGSGPYLQSELGARGVHLVFLIQICSIILPMQIVVFSHSPSFRSHRFRREPQHATGDGPGSL